MRAAYACARASTRVSRASASVCQGRWLRGEALEIGSEVVNVSGMSGEGVGRGEGGGGTCRSFLNRCCAVARISAHHPLSSCVLASTPSLVDQWAPAGQTRIVRRSTSLRAARCPIPAMPTHGAAVARAGWARFARLKVCLPFPFLPEGRGGFWAGTSLFSRRPEGSSCTSKLGSPLSQYWPILPPLFCPRSKWVTAPATRTARRPVTRTPSACGPKCRPCTRVRGTRACAPGAGRARSANSKVGVKALLLSCLSRYPLPLSAGESGLTCAC